jgi:hypothetical protein
MADPIRVNRDDAPSRWRVSRCQPQGLLALFGLIQSFQHPAIRRCNRKNAQLHSFRRYEPYQVATVVVLLRRDVHALSNRTNSIARCGLCSYANSLRSRIHQNTRRLFSHYSRLMLQLRRGASPQISCCHTLQGTRPPERGQMQNRAGNTKKSRSDFRAAIPWHAFSDEVFSRSVHVPLSDHEGRATDRLR